MGSYNHQELEKAGIVWKIPLERSKKQKLPNVPIEIDGKISQSAIIDSGATMCVITSAEAYRIWGNSMNRKLKHTRFNMLGVDDKKLDVLGSIRTSVKMGKLSTVFDFVIINSPSKEILIGLDFLIKHHLTLISDKYIAKIILDKKSQQLNERRKEIIPKYKKSYLAMAEEDSVIEPFQGLTSIKLKLDTDENLNGKLVVLTTEYEQTELEVHELIGLWTIDTVINNTANILMHNKDYPAPIRINKGESIAKAWVMEEEDYIDEKVRRILEHIDKETKFYDDETLNKQIQVETIGLESIVNMDVEEAIEEANIVNKKYMNQIKEILNIHKKAISVHDYDLGKYNLEKIKIKMDDLTPIHSPYRPAPPQLRNKAIAVLDQLEKYGIITRGYSPFAAQIRWVPKAQLDDHSRIPGQKAQNQEDPEPRMAIDYSHMRDKVTLGINPTGA